MNSSLQLRIQSLLFETALATPRVGSGKLASAIIYRGNIISVGFNQNKTHPMQLKWMVNPKRTTLHAEVNAIVRASRVLGEYEFSRSSIYVARVKKEEIRGNWMYGMAKPCAGCMRCIISFGIRELWYSTDDGDFDRLKLN